MYFGILQYRRNGIWHSSDQPFIANNYDAPPVATDEMLPFNIATKSLSLFSIDTVHSSLDLKCMVCNIACLLFQYINTEVMKNKLNPPLFCGQSLHVG